MAKRYVHTCVRVLDEEKSVAFYEALGYERRGKLQFETAYNVYMGLPGDSDTLELTVNIGRTEPYDLGDGYNHIALTVDDLDALLGELSGIGVEPEKPPFAPGGQQPGQPAGVEELELAQVEHDTRRSCRLDAAQLLVERVRVSEVELAAQGDPHRSRVEFLDGQPEAVHCPVSSARRMSRN